MLVWRPVRPSSRCGRSRRHRIAGSAKGTAAQSRKSGAANPLRSSTNGKTIRPITEAITRKTIRKSVWPTHQRVYLTQPRRVENRVSRLVLVPSLTHSVCLHLGTSGGIQASTIGTTALSAA